MKVAFLPHALERMAERGANEAEIVKAVESGEQFPAKFGRKGFRLTLDCNGHWMGRAYAHKQLEVFAVEENGAWLVITVVVKYFQGKEE
jgi:hypothetical protein